jgi:hypothetical protein
LRCVPLFDDSFSGYALAFLKRGFCDLVRRVPNAAPALNVHDDDAPTISARWFAWCQNAGRFALRAWVNQQH